MCIRDRLEGFGYPLAREGSRTVAVTGRGRLTGTEIDVPADISSAAFFLVGASIAPGSDLVLEHVGVNPTRTGAIDILRLMGAEDVDKRQTGWTRRISSTSRPRWIVPTPCAGSTAFPI